mgnify:CR=1 FL=1
MDISEVLADADAVLDAYYPGQFGATAIAGESLPPTPLVSPYTHNDMVQSPTCMVDKWYVPTALQRRCSVS